MDYGKYQRLKINRRDRVLTVAFNRPAVVNAVDQQTHDELVTIFDDIQRDDDTHVAILTGVGKAFSAGGDINWLGETSKTGDGPSPVDGKRIINSLIDLEKPIIARVTGACVGLGATLALFCDMIFASTDARIGDPHVLVGLVAGDGGAVIWPHLIGHARAKQYLLTGDLMTAQQAADMGLINAVVDVSELDAIVDGYATRLANGPTKAIRWTKASVNVGLRQLAHAIMESCIPLETLSFKTNDHREAVLAFQERRKPAFTGT